MSMQFHDIDFNATFYKCHIPAGALLIHEHVSVALFHMIIKGEWAL